MNRTKILLWSASLLLTLALAGGASYYIKTQKYESPAGSDIQTDAIDNAGSSSNDDIFDQAGDEAPAIEISEGAVKMMAVKSTRAEVMPMSHTIRTVGRIEVDEKGLHNINIKVEGWIEKLFVNYTGKSVRKGELVAEIYSPELLATQQELLDSIKWENGQKGDYAKMLSQDAKSVTDAARQRLRLWDISDKQINSIISSGKPMRTLAAYSPADGVVIEKNAVLGAKIMPGEKLFTIADLSTVWIIADVYESEMHFIKPGQKARISMSHLPDSEITSTVDFISPSIDNNTRTLQVRFEVKNPDAQLKPSMYTNIEISIDLGQRLVVPKSALIDSGQRQIVYVNRGEGFFEPRQIRTGISGGSMVEVTEGLMPGDLVAESGTFLLDSEAQLKGVRPLEAK